MHDIDLSDLFYDSEGELTLEENRSIGLLGVVYAEDGGVDS